MVSIFISSHQTLPLQNAVIGACWFRSSLWPCMCSIQTAKSYDSLLLSSIVLLEAFSFSTFSSVYFQVNHFVHDLINSKNSMNEKSDSSSLWVVLYTSSHRAWDSSYASSSFIKYSLLMPPKSPVAFTICLNSSYYDNMLTVCDAINMVRLNQSDYEIIWEAIVLSH